MVRTTRFLPVLILVLALVAACGGTAAPAPTAAAPTAAAEEAVTEEVAAEEAAALQEPAAEAVVEPAPVETAMPEVGEPAAITVEQLRNAAYSGIYDEPVTLTEGLYEGEPFAEGDPARPTVEYVEGAELYGDLDGDGVEDAVVFLREWGGGTGHFTYVAAQLNQGGQPVDAGTVWMDEISVRSAAIEDGQVLVEIITMGPGDADCCQTHKASRIYALEGGQLAEMAGEEEDLEQISAADLNGTSWTLIELDEGQPALDDVDVTISFQDGQISGSGGCNNYNSSFSMGEDNPFVMTIDPVASTKMACPEPILEQETSYFAALENASQWGYEFGRLALPYYVEGQAGLSRLLFAPQAGAASGQADSLTGQSWQWVSFTDPLQSYEVESPESYTLTFNENGTVNIVADCNNASGSYTDDDGALNIEIGPMTMAACPPDSRSDEFVKLLGGAARYFYEQGFLYIDLFADGGTMAFAPQTEPGYAGDITSYPWRWILFTSPVEKFDVEAPENYVVIFNDDGTVNIKADCNNVSGSYTVDSGSLTIKVGPMTKAACSPESRSNQFVELLGYAAIYFFEDAQLHIDLFADGGTMVFAPEGEAELAAAADAAQSAAEIANDEGGPVSVAGEWNYTSAYVQRHFTEPVAILLDVSHQVQGDVTEWVTPDGQVMGSLTRPLAPAPTAYEVELPIQPDGGSVDLDNDGEDDAGVQMYAAVVSSNLIGDSYLEEFEQGGFASYLQDPLTGNIREGTFLVYAPDDRQGFPVNAGEDGVYFTDDDSAVGLPAGYTVVTLSLDGTVSFDRSREATMPILEAAAYVSPDFSDQGILESFNSLIDVLKERYAYTELRGLDWEAIREEYLPRVQEADQAEDFQAYFNVMNDLALSIEDAHVYLSTLDFGKSTSYYLEVSKAFNGGLGVSVVELSDGRIVVNYLDPEGPGGQVGWQVGTEILTVNGVSIDEHIDALPLLESAGNPEAIRLEKIKRALNFPEGSEVSIEVLQPGESQPSTATLTASYEGTVLVPEPPIDEDEISFKQLDNGTYYIQWKQFYDELYKIAVWEKLLEKAKAAPGIIIDLRHNGGGSIGLMYALMSYLFPPDDTAQLHWFDAYVYDDQTGDLVKEYATDLPLSSLKPNLTYTGPVVVLVSESSASAAEYAPQFLQTQGRATVVGEHGTEGAGGYVETATMPGDFSFNFTKSRTYFAGTDQLNLEAKGLTLDVRVPTTLENELAKQEGRDVVLEAALQVVEEEAARLAAERLAGTTWQLTKVQTLIPGTASMETTEIENPGSYMLSFEQDGQITIQADCNQATGEFTLSGGNIMIEVGPVTLAACPEGSQGETFLALLPGEKQFEIEEEEEGKQVLLLYTPAELGDIALLYFEAVERALSSAGAGPSSAAGELPADVVAQLDACLQSQVWTEGGNPAGAAPGLVLLVDTPERAAT